MFGARPQTSVQSRAYWIFLLFFRRAFCALKYAIGTTGFTSDIASYRTHLCHF